MLTSNRLESVVLKPLLLSLGLLLAGCAIPPLEPRDAVEGHVYSKEQASNPEDVAASAAIPKPVTRRAILPPPQPTAPIETYTVVVNGVPVRELLFALARDAAINVDIHPKISGDVTLNAIDQSLPQILSRLSSQLDLRYRFDGNLLTITPDTPYLRTYKVDYVNLARTTSNSVNVSTQVQATSSAATGGGGGGGGDNNSETKLESVASHNIWQTLTTTIEAMVQDPERIGANEEGAQPDSKSVFANAETGLITVRATDRQHAQIQQYVERVLNELRRQVMIEVSVVEVRLSDRYQAGIDWSKLPVNAGLAISQALIGGPAAAAATAVPSVLAGGNRPFFFVEYANQRDANGTPSGDLTVTASFLKEFGDVRIISSPKIMALNNQTALLKVVDNRVYFEVETETVVPETGPAITNTNTTPRTVPIGFVMAVTPQINAADQVTLNVRPTITRILEFINDPNPDLANAGTTNRVPVLQVREFESVLQVESGRIAVLGGLMQDQNNKSTGGVPLLSDIPEIGELFTFRDHNFTKTELVLFIRPWVIRNPSVLEGDLVRFQRALPENLTTKRPINSPPKEVQFK